MAKWRRNQRTFNDENSFRVVYTSRNNCNIYMLTVWPEFQTILIQKGRIRRANFDSLLDTFREYFWIKSAIYNCTDETWYRHVSRKRFKRIINRWRDKCWDDRRVFRAREEFR